VRQAGAFEITDKKILGEKQVGGVPVYVDANLAMPHKVE